MRRLMLMLGVLLVPVGVSAQTHPCDAAEVSTGKQLENAPLFAVFCSSPAENVDAVTIRRNGTPTLLSPLELVTPTPSTSGKVQYRVSVGTFTRGTYSITASAWNKTMETDGSPAVAQEGPESSPFALSVVAAISPPGAPSHLKIGR